MPVERFVGEPGRLDAVLTRLPAGSTRADVQRAIAAGHVTVDGVVRNKSFALAGGETLAMVMEAADTPLEPEGPAVPVLFDDEHLLVVAKPAGLVTHPTERRRTGTLVNRLLFMGVPLSSAGGPLRPGIVHRLDAGTSGLMLVAKTDDAHEALVAMFRRHEVERRYLALVRGRVDTSPSPWTRRSAGTPPGWCSTRRGPARRDRVRGPGAAGLRDVARGRAPDRPHASDPGAPVVDRPSDPGRPRLRGAGDDARRAGARAAVPALLAPRVRPSAHRGARSSARSPSPRTWRRRSSGRDATAPPGPSRPAALTASGGGRTLRFPRITPM